MVLSSGSNNASMKCLWHCLGGSRSAKVGELRSISNPIRASSCSPVLRSPCHRMLDECNMHMKLSGGLERTQRLQYLHHVMVFAWWWHCFIHLCWCIEMADLRWGCFAAGLADWGSIWIRKSLIDLISVLPYPRKGSVWLTRKKS